MAKLKELLHPRSMLGLCIILIALVVFFDMLGINLFGKILSNWPLGLIIIGIAMLYGPEKPENRTLPYILIIVGVFFFLGQFHWWHFQWQKLIFPLILLAIGVYILMPQFSRGRPGAFPENRISIFTVLGGGEYNTRSANLTGGHIVSILGGADVDIRDADIEGDGMEINVLALMGGVEIRVPLHWQVSMRAVPFLGGVSNQTTFLADKLQMPKKTLVIRGLALMGGIDVRN